MILQKGEYTIISGLHEGFQIGLILTHEGHKMNTIVSFTIILNQKYRMVYLASPSFHRPHTHQSLLYLLKLQIQDLNTLLLGLQRQWVHYRTISSPMFANTMLVWTWPKLTTLNTLHNHNYLHQCVYQGWIKCRWSELILFTHTILDTTMRADMEKTNWTRPFLHCWHS